MKSMPNTLSQALERAWTGWRPERAAHGNVGRPFDLSYRVQQHWGAKVAFYLYLGGTGAGLVFLEVLLRWWGILDAWTAGIGMWIGLALAVLSALAIFDHLGPVSRWNAFFAFRNLRRSWISRGVTMLFVLLVLRLLLALPTLPGAEGLPWAEGRPVGDALRVVVLLFAFAFMAYTGLVISSWNSIAFWNTPLVPVLFTGFSLLGGLVALPAIAWVASGPPAAHTVFGFTLSATLVLLAGDAALLALYIYGMTTATRPARVSVTMLLRGTVSRRFVGGAVGLGVLAPALVFVPAAFGTISCTDATAPLFFAAIGAVQIGGYFLRDAILRAGVYGPPV